MLLRLVLLFVTLPMLETVLLLALADSWGFSTTFALVIVSGLLGAYLLRRQGLRAVRRIRAELSHGRLPATDLLDGMLIVAAGVMLITPGILTDALGIALLIPVSRSKLRSGLIRWFQSRWRLQSLSSSPGQAGDAGRNSQVIDSYVVRSDDEKDRSS